MKKIVLILIMFLCLSCSDNDNDNDIIIIGTEFPQTWELVAMSGNVPNSTTTGDDMEWQEYYVLNNDQTFSKTRTREDVTTTESGTFEFFEQNSEDYLLLTYPTNNDIIGNCTAEFTEEFILTDKDKMSSTWRACDGPGLNYELKVD
ncbi:hypothetical protein [Urechidicola croceus]|uniref:Lipocalin-like domain-containing protein n=1 Tax=Urechidicola croceus TaxID=1850246 RepID=A0A1D8P522_9FLAO|nr:hypothetical protein [Urechidicola croceus]AOW19664.1 hypothetical protein LPB138_02755 [Urechidicola croceus]